MAKRSEVGDVGGVCRDGEEGAEEVELVGVDDGFLSMLRGGCGSGREVARTKPSGALFLSMAVDRFDLPHLLSPVFDGQCWKVSSIFRSRSIGELRRGRPS